MKVLVTGAAGFIGSHLAEALPEAGHQVAGIDNYLTGRNGTWHRGDIAHSLFPNVDVIAHCAASYNDPTNWGRDLKTNALGTARVAAHARNIGARVVYFQTSLCYGIKPPPYPIPPSHPLDPAGSYAVSKTAGEMYLRDSGAPFISFRLANIYGPRNLSGPIPTFYKKLKAGKGCTVVDSRRDFVYVDDAVDVFVKGVESEATGVFHVSTGGDYPIFDVWAAVANHVPGECDLKPRGEDDAPSILLDSTKTQTEFGWKATTTLEEGIGKAVEWYNQHGVGDTFTHLVGV